MYQQEGVRDYPSPPPSHYYVEPAASTKYLDRRNQPTWGGSVSNLPRRAIAPRKAVPACPICLSAIAITSPVSSAGTRSLRTALAQRRPFSRRWPAAAQDAPPLPFFWLDLNPLRTKFVLPQASRLRRFFSDAGHPCDRFPLAERWLVSSLPVTSRIPPAPRGLPVSSGTGSMVATKENTHRLAVQCLSLITIIALSCLLPARSRPKTPRCRIRTLP